MGLSDRSGATGNALLDGLGVDAVERLRPHMRRRVFAGGSLLAAPNRKTQSVYYITRGVAADIVDTEDGISVVASMVGSEGMIGLPLLLGAGGVDGRWLWLVDGEAWRVPMAMLDGELGEALSRFAAAELVEKRLTAACHHVHSVEQRIARYLLEVDERVDDFNQLTLTHEQLSVMVGVTRPRVSAALDSLERRGAIFRGRGRLLIRDASRLKALACACLDQVRQVHRALNLTAGNIGRAGEPQVA